MALTERLQKEVLAALATGVRVPPRRGQAADLLLGRPGRASTPDVLKDRLYTTAVDSGVARCSGAERAVSHHPGHAALDGAVPVVHRRGS
ncbi:hypothetical protein ACTMU2_38135, partial [Cupriavidus basilensis]